MYYKTIFVNHNHILILLILAAAKPINNMLKNFLIY